MQHHCPIPLWPAPCSSPAHPLTEVATQRLHNLPFCWIVALSYLLLLPNKRLKCWPGINVFTPLSPGEEFAIFLADLPHPSLPLYYISVTVRCLVCLCVYHRCPTEMAMAVWERERERVCWLVCACAVRAYPSDFQGYPWPLLFMLFAYAKKFLCLATNKYYINTI